jgi:hypothetical protein
VPTDDEIETTLRRKAGKGDVAAARELRERTKGRQPRVRSLNEDLLSLLSDAQLTWVEGWVTRTLETPTLPEGVNSTPAGHTAA